MTRPVDMWKLTVRRVDYFIARRRWVPLLRAIWLGIKFDNGEDCQVCGRAMPLVWYAPEPLWLELKGDEGLICPRCFTERADDHDILIRWVPQVARRDGIPTSNWWLEPIRDALMMGEPAPHLFDTERVEVPQPPWDAVGEALGLWLGSYYPVETIESLGETTP